MFHNFLIMLKMYQFLRLQSFIVTLYNEFSCFKKVYYIWMIENEIMYIEVIT
jgi:hypothetical protein